MKDKNNKSGDILKRSNYPEHKHIKDHDQRRIPPSKGPINPERNDPSKPDKPNDKSPEKK